MYAALHLRDMGMHPLTCTWAPHAYTDVGRRNFYRWLEMGFDNILVTPNPKVHALLTRLAFLNLLHPFQPFVLGQRSLAPRVAAAWGIDLVMFGELDDDYEGEGQGWQEKEEAPHLEEVCIAGVEYPRLCRDFGLAPADLQIYAPGRAGGLGDRTGDRKVSVQALGRYIRWDPLDAYLFASERGFEANDHRTEGTFSKGASIDDKLDPLHYFGMVVKCGVGRASHDASIEIRHGRMTREEGVALVRQFDTEEPRRYLADCLAYMGLTLAEYRATIDRFREASGLWERTGTEGTWRLAEQVS